MLLEDNQPIRTHSAMAGVQLISKKKKNTKKPSALSNTYCGCLKLEFRVKQSEIKAHGDFCTGTYKKPERWDDFGSVLKVFANKLSKYVPSAVKQ